MNNHNRLFATLALFVMLWGLMITPASAQRSRRNPPTKPPATKAKTTPEAPNLEKLEERNKELLKQILDLQYERDFYRKKLAEWTEAQRLALEEKKEPPEPAATPTQPLVIPYPVTGWPPPITAAAAQPHLTPVDSVFRLARQSYRARRFIKAQELFEELISLPGCHDEHYLAYGTFLYRMGNYSKALDILNLVTEVDSLQGKAAFYRTRIYQEQGNRQLARVEMIRCRYLSATPYAYQTTLAYSLLGQGLLDSAAILFTSLLQYATGYEAEIYAGLAAIARQKQDSAQGIQWLQASLGCEPGDVRIAYHLGVALLANQDYNASLSLLQTAVQYPQPEMNIHHYLGQAYYYTQQWERAIEEFMQVDTTRMGAEAQATWLAKSYYLLSLNAKAQGNFFEATNCLRKARQADSDASKWMQAALQDLAQIYEKERRFNRALETYWQQLRLSPQDGAIWLKLGEMCYHIGAAEEARRLFHSALRFPEYTNKAEKWLNQLESISP